MTLTTGTGDGGLPATVKLVIWDLDETFWKGTLSEGGIVAIPAHVAMIRTLVDRGIMCAVCSKNDAAAAKAELVSLDVADLFVFSHIDWTPKGQAIAAMLAQMGLLAENAVFLDDNTLNLEEARFFNPGLCTLDPTERELAALLSEPGFAGKDDRDHERLTQYRLLEEKQEDRATSGLTNEAFLRQSDICVRIESDIDGQMDRVLELLNRTNQLNFTKVRANTDPERRALQLLLAESGVHAGLVQVRDRYGDYGTVGFFCVRKQARGTTVHHLVFSCRTLNMGVEQWVWEHLGRPAFRSVRPVANPIDAYDKVDWIRQVRDFDETGAGPGRSLCLVGGCDLQQVSFYCGADRTEFVNRQDAAGMLVRYDDVGFFLNPRDAELKASLVLPELVGQTFDEMEALDSALRSSDVILLSMYFSVPTDNLFTFGGTEFGGRFWATFPPARLRALMRDPATALRFAKVMHHRRLTIGARVALTRECLVRADGLRKADSGLFVVSAVAGRGPQAAHTPGPRRAYNDMARAFCAETPGATFVDIEAILADEDFNDSDHFTRKGYYKIAEFVNARMGGTAMPSRSESRDAAPTPRPKSTPSGPKIDDDEEEVVFWVDDLEAAETADATVSRARNI